jgi:hypothetical protein
VREISYITQKILFNSVLHALFGNDLTQALKGFVVVSQVSTLTPDHSFDHNSCILGLNG